MPFTKSAQRKGGKAAASDRQKTIAKETILRTEPWKKSTGPTTKEGKKAVTKNVRLEYVFRFAYEFGSRDSAQKASTSFVAKAKELHQHLKSQGLGVVNCRAVSVCCDGKTVTTNFRASLRCPTPEGIEIGKRWFSDKTWLS